MVHSQTLQPFRQEISWKHFWNEKVVIFCENAKNMKNATGYFCVKETLFSGIVKKLSSFWEHKTNCFRMQNRVRFSSFIFLLLAFMVLHEIFNFASRITCFFLWKQAPFRWCVLKIQKNLTRKMGFLHFCCWITKCNFEKKYRVFQRVGKNQKCQITVFTIESFTFKKKKGKCFVATNVIKHGYFLRYKFAKIN